jgi:Ethanolamine utilization protein EutJ (predicted chaperonin)
MKSFDLKELMARFKTVPNDLVGIDVGATSMKVVRMKKVNDQITVTGVDILAAPKLPVPQVPAAEAKTEGADPKPAEGSGAEAALPKVEPVVLPAKLKGKYVSLAVTGASSVIKLHSFPGAFDAAAEDKVINAMGLDDPGSYRIGYKVITEGHGKSESKVLGVALPEAESVIFPLMFPHGIPAPFSLEVSGLACLSSFLHSAGAAVENEAVGVIDFGTSVTTFALFSKGVLVLIRRFDFGTDAVCEKVQEMLGVDKETAQGIINDGAFDVSQAVSDVMEQLNKQIIVSRDFVERRENCHVTKMFVSGGLVMSRNSLDELRASLGLEVASWNPFEGLTVAPDAIAENVKGQEWRFTAAVGACLATFEEI